MMHIYILFRNIQKQSLNAENQSSKFLYVINTEYSEKVPTGLVRKCHLRIRVIKESNQLVLSFNKNTSFPIHEYQNLGTLPTGDWRVAGVLGEVAVTAVF